jgi:hypothetical protein
LIALMAESHADNPAYASAGTAFLRGRDPLALAYG